MWLCQHVMTKWAFFLSFSLSLVLHTDRREILHGPIRSALAFTDLNTWQYWTTLDTRCLFITVFVIVSCHFFLNSEESTKQVFHSHGMSDGLFLLRESRSRVSTFILSLCHENQVKHYKVKDSDRGFCLVDQSNDQCPEEKDHKKYYFSLHLLISNHNHVKVNYSFWFLSSLTTTTQDGLPVILKTNCSPSVTGWCVAVIQFKL